MNLCPYCAKEIEESTKRCPYCNEYLKAFDYLLSKKRLFMSNFLITSICYGLITYFLKRHDQRDIFATVVSSSAFGLFMAVFFILVNHRRRIIKSKTIVEGTLNKFGYNRLIKNIITFGFILWPTFILGTFLAYKYHYISSQLYYLSLVVFGFFLLLNIPAWYQIHMSVLIDEEGVIAEYPFGRQIKIKWQDIVSIESPKSYGLESRKNTIIIKSIQTKIKFDTQLEGFALLMKKIKEKAINLKSS